MIAFGPYASGELYVFGKPFVQPLASSDGQLPVGPQNLGIFFWMAFRDLVIQGRGYLLLDSGQWWVQAVFLRKVLPPGGGG